MCQQTQLLPGKGAWLGLLTPAEDKGFPWEVWRGSRQLPRRCDVVQSLLCSPRKPALVPSCLPAPADVLHALLAPEKPRLLSAGLLAGTQFPSPGTGRGSEATRAGIVFLD